MFQPNSSFRTVLEMIEMLQENEFFSANTPSIYIMTDGRPEHMVCFDSVKIPLLLTFHHFSLQSLIGIQTAPGHSFANVVEGVMFILNIGFQIVG